MGRREYSLGKGELEVLRALWDQGPASVRDVMNYLHERGRKVAYTTVQTVLGRLEQKGVVQSDRAGLAYVYRARVSRARFSRSRLTSLLDQLYDGAAGQLVLQLIRTKRLTTEEIEELRKLIERLDSHQE
jgi:BlaI family penicillinase repressor